MGILHKLAELVVEFPEKEQPKAEGEEPDVLASIQRIQDDIAGDLARNRPNFSNSPAASDPAKPAPSGGPAAAGGGPATAGGDSIRLPDILSIPALYERANIKSTPDSFDVFRVEQMLADPEIADLPLETRARSVRMALRSMGKELPDLLADAARRDQILEAYEQFLREAQADVSHRVTEANGKLQREVDEFVRLRTAEMEGNRATLQRAQDGLAAFLKTKSVEEKRLFDIVAPFVAPGQNPVQLSDGDAKPKGGK